MRIEMCIHMFRYF